LEFSIRHTVGLAGALLAVGCGQPCATGFSRSDDGVCRADTPCPSNAQREQDLACHPVSSGESLTTQTDTGYWADDTAENEPTESTEPIQDTGAADSGPGRIWVSYEGLEGVPAHGFFVFGEVSGKAGPIASFCQIILADPMTVQGYLVPFDGDSDPCPNTGEPELFDEEQVVLNMIVAQGASSEPVLCDQRVIDITGDQIVDFSDVIACGG